MRLRDFKALTFDVYGTLIDWETGMINGLKPLTDQLKEPLNRDAILEAHAVCESTAQRFTPAKSYRDILALVYRRLAEMWGLTTSPEACETYGHSVEHWPAFPDSADALAYLGQHFKLIVLSNVDRASFAYSDIKLGQPFDATYLAGDIGSYKPAPRNFDYMLQHLRQIGIEKPDVLHVAESMFHDHVPARRYKLANCWIYRRHEQTGFGATINPGKLPDYNFMFTSMADLAAAHRADLGGH